MNPFPLVQILKQRLVKRRRCIEKHKINVVVETLFFVAVDEIAERLAIRFLNVVRLCHQFLTSFEIAKDGIASKSE